jgi:LPS-assembly lipoprotein
LSEARRRRAAGSRRPARALLTTLLLATVVAGCGFELQGRPSVPPGMQRTYIDSDDRYSLFYRELRRELVAAGVRLEDEPSADAATFRILADDTGQRVLSVSARNVPTEYEVYYSIRYGVEGNDGKVLLPAQDLTLTRDYLYDPTVVLGKAREEEALRNAIVGDLVRIILKQVSTQ